MSQASLISYHTSSTMHHTDAAEMLAATAHSAASTWVCLHVIEGHVALLNAGEQQALDTNSKMEPTAISALGALTSDDAAQLQVELLCSAEDYYGYKYQLTRTHSEVIAAMPYLNGGKALDLGCGNGRNSLYLNLNGFEVQGFDRNSLSIANLNRIIGEEGLTHINASEQDLADLLIEDDYDFILSTVVMMFLPENTVPQLIRQMQQHTKAGGLNLIVSAMDTADYPSTVGFPFRFKENELLNYYADWDVIKYNENVGELHKLDENGNRIKLRFATLLARKS